MEVESKKMLKQRDYTFLKIYTLEKQKMQKLKKSVEIQKSYCIFKIWLIFDDLLSNSVQYNQV